MPSSAASPNGSALPSMFAERRRRYFEHLGDAAALLPTAPECVRSNDTSFTFRPDNDFFYLTGFPEPEAVAVLLPPGAAHRYVLFVRAKNPERETWDGRRAGVEGAVSHYGADVAYPIEELRERLPQLLESVDTLHFAIGRNQEIVPIVLDVLNGLKRTRPRRGTGPISLRDPGAWLAEQRLIKTRPELDRLRRACDITAEAHELAMRITKPEMWEYQVEATLDYVFRSRGGSGWGYPHIVAGGENATILHYTENESQLRDGELLLIDAGAEFECYSADVTRTFPVGTRFTDEQRKVYDIVLRAHQESMQLVRPGNRFADIHDHALKVLTAGLVELGILGGNVEELIAEKKYEPYYMHRTGHWLGLDVHDAGLYTVDGESRVLEPGMVLTVEPGLYFGDYAGEVDARWKGIGVRVEDDVLVTETGFENLTEACPVEPSAIESLCAEGLSETALLTTTSR